jgi:hypothetical protein
VGGRQIEAAIRSATGSRANTVRSVLLGGLCCRHVAPNPQAMPGKVLPLSASIHSRGAPDSSSP